MGIEIISKLGFKDFKVMLNNRKILNAIAEYSGRPEKLMEIVYVIDDWFKRTPKENRAELLKRELSEAETDKIFSLVQKQFDNNTELINYYEGLLKNTQEGQEGIKELREIIKLVEDPRLEFTPTIARGLAYYTGPVWEWYVTEGGVGSIGGCGRYDKLISSFLGRNIPATGGSFGFERIMEVLTDRDMLPSVKTKIEVLVSVFNTELSQASFSLASRFRDLGINAMIYPANKPLKKQFEFADKKGIPFVAVIGEDEIKSGNISLKNMNEKKQELLDFDSAVKMIKTPKP
jgi:histidyl-tRNA synthetase